MVRRAKNPWLGPHTDTVDVYRNLNNGRLSVKNRGLGSKVAGHFDRVELKDVELVVSAARLKYMREVKKKRTVVAYARGDVVDVSEEPGRIPTSKDWVEVTFNPWIWDTFVTSKGQRPVYGAKRAIVVGGRVYAKGPVYRPPAKRSKRRNPPSTTIGLPADFFPSYGEHREQLKSVRQDIYQRTGEWLTLEEAEVVLKKAVTAHAKEMQKRFRVI